MKPTVARVAILVSGLSLVASALAAETHAVRFDDLPVGTLVTSQYEEEGVVFSGGTAAVRIADADPPGTESPPQALEAVHQEDLPWHEGPIRFRFRSPQYHVKVWVGLRYSGNDPQTEAVLRLFDADGDLIEKKYVALGSGPRSVRVPLGIDVGESRIRRCELQYVRHFMLDGIEWDEDTGGVELLDSLMWDGEPPPPPPEDDPPAVHIASPTSGFVFFGDRPMIPLSGTVTEDRAIAALTFRQVCLDEDPDPPLSSLGWTGAAPRFTFPDHPETYRIELRPGRNRITVEARDSGDQTDSDTVEVILATAPVVTFTSPAAGSETDQPRVTVRGRIAKPYGSLYRGDVTVRRVGSGEPAVPVDALTGNRTDGYAFSAAVDLSDSGSRQRNTIRVSAEDEGGLVGAADLEVWVVRPDKVGLARLDVTQATRSSLSIAGRLTAARIAASTSDPALGTLLGVRAELRGFRDGVELPGSPLAAWGGGTLDLDPADSVEDRRGDVAKTWNFWLPDAWTEEGSIDLVAEVDPENDLEECGVCRIGNVLERTVRFQEGDALTIQPVIVSCLWNGVRMAPTAAEAADALRAFERVYPYGRITILPTQTLTSNVDLRPNFRTARREILDEIYDRFTCWDQGDFWGVIGDWLEDCSWSTYTIGLLPINGGSCPGGVSFLHSPAGVGSANAWTPVHEIGHAVGLSHTADDHGEDGGGGHDPDYPYDHGRIGDVGFDTAAALAIPLEEPYPAGVPDLADVCGECNSATDACHTHDFMSYGEGPMWVSDYVWNHLHYNGFSGSVRGGGSGAGSDDERGSGAAPAPFVHITGTVDPDGSVHLRPFYVGYASAQQIVLAGKGAFEARLLDRSGRLLAARRFQPESPQDADGDRISVLLPLAEGAGAIEVFRDDVRVGGRKVSPTPPEVSVLEPNGGEIFESGETILVRWKARDEDGDRLLYGVQYSPDDGTSWRNLAFLVKETELEVDLDDVPGSKLGRFRVLATDGVLSTRDESDGTFVVGGKPPVARIIRPLDGASVAAGDPVPLAGTASDREDGSVPDASLVWTSSLDGALGTGARVDVARLSPGAHVIRLRARDASGATGSAEVRILVGPAASGGKFIRGDSSDDGKVNISDAIFTLSFLFLGGPRPACDDAADANDDGGLNLSDALYTLNFLFLGGPAPSPPYPTAGADPTQDELGCRSGVR